MVKSSSSKPLIFISHIHEEESIALALAHLLKESFNGAIQVFCSANLNLGLNWHEEIMSALEKCIFKVIIASPTSLQRVWIGFETGINWRRSIPKVPMCHSGMTVCSLPTPYNCLMAGMATEIEDVEKLLTDIARACNLGVPTVDVSEFIQAVHQFENRTKIRGDHEMKEKSLRIPFPIMSGSSEASAASPPASQP